MLSRIKHLFKTPRRVADNVNNAQQRVGQLEAELERLNGRIDELETSILPGLIVLAERGLATHIEVVAVDAKRHAEEATDAAQTTAIRVAREHTEAAVAAAATSVAATAHEHAEAAALAASETSREHAEELGAQVQRHLADELGAIRRELRTMRRVQASAAVSPVVSGEPETAIAPVAIDPAFYVALEDRFRGDPSTIAERQRIYLPLVEHLVDGEHRVIDLGCGRGEWLSVLHEARVPAAGVDLNPAFTSEVAELGLEVIQHDLVTYLQDAPDASIGAITMFQVVEHLPLDVLLDVFEQCARALRPGGILIAETPNSLNLRVASSTFWLDPTHQKPLHPELLQFMATQAGFTKTDGWFVNALREMPTDLSADSTGNEVLRLVDMVDGAGDFALLAWA